MFVEPASIYDYQIKVWTELKKDSVFKKMSDLNDLEWLVEVILGTDGDGDFVFKATYNYSTLPVSMAAPERELYLYFKGGILKHSPDAVEMED